MWLFELRPCFEMVSASIAPLFATAALNLNLFMLLQLKKLKKLKKNIFISCAYSESLCVVVEAHGFRPHCRPLAHNGAAALRSGGRFTTLASTKHLPPAIVQNRLLYAVILDGRNSRVGAARVNYIE